jgi:hypothetical protein
VLRQVSRAAKRKRDADTGARTLAGRYGSYFRDICSLDPDNMACTRVVGWTREPGDSPSAYDFLFAASEPSARVYWSTVAVAGPSVGSPRAQSFWDEVPTLTGGDVSGFAGAATYRPPTATPQAAMNDERLGLPVLDHARSREAHARVFALQPGDPRVGGPAGASVAARRVQRARRRGTPVTAPARLVRGRRGGRWQAGDALLRRLAQRQGHGLGREGARRAAAVVLDSDGRGTGAHPARPARA